MRKLPLTISQALILLFVTMTGCTGHANLTLIPLSSAALNPDSPLEFKFTPQECYWWMDDEGKINLALSYHNLPLLGDYSRDSLELSLILDERPADKICQCRVNRKTLRGIWHRGPFHLRLRSRRGIIAVKYLSQDIITGRFRLFCMSQKFEVLTDWQPQAQVLIQGQFTAIRNPEKGRPILDRTEKDYPRVQRADSTGSTFIPG